MIGSNQIVKAQSHLGYIQDRGRFDKVEVILRNIVQALCAEYSSYVLVYQSYIY